VSPWASEYRRLVDSREIIDINLRAIEQTRQALAGVPLIEYTYKFTTSYTKAMRYPMPSLGVRSFDFVDHAEDMMHPGPKTNAIIAQWLAESIKKPT
jgi:lysophospholipase L1-like esterase